MTPLVIALLTAVIGLLVYVFAPERLTEAGRAMLWAGAFAVVAILCRLL